MKMVYATLLALTLTACGNAPGTTSEMAGKGSNASNLGATDSNGMATESGTTQSKGASGADDPAARSNDTGNAQHSAVETSNEARKKATSKKADQTRPGTSHDLTGGNDSADAAKGESHK